MHNINFLAHNVTHRDHQCIQVTGGDDPCFSHIFVDFTTLVQPTPPIRWRSNDLCESLGEYTLCDQSVKLILRRDDNDDDANGVTDDDGDEYDEDGMMMVMMMMMMTVMMMMPVIANVNCDANNVVRISASINSQRFIDAYSQVLQCESVVR